MPVESPLEYYVRRSNELGIPLDKLLSQKHLGFIADAVSHSSEYSMHFSENLLVDILIRKQGSFLSYFFNYTSEKNSLFEFLAVTHEVDLRLQDNGFFSLVPSIEYKFELWRPRAIGGDRSSNFYMDVSIIVRDSKIAGGGAVGGGAIDRSKAFLSEWVEPGQDYRPALDFILKRYAAGLASHP